MTRTSPGAGEEHHGRSSQRIPGDTISQPLLARIGTADRPGVQCRPGVQGWVGRRGLEDPRRGPSHRQCERAALQRHSRRRSPSDRIHQYRVDHRPAPACQSAGDQEGQARVAGPGHRRFAHGALRRGCLEEDPFLGRGHRGRWCRTEFRLPPRDVRARHGLGGRTGAGIHRNGHALVQGPHPHAGHRQADPQRDRYSHPGPGRPGWRRRRGVADQHPQFHHRRRPRRHGAGAAQRRQGDARRLLRPSGQADRPQHGSRDRSRSGNRDAAHLRYRRHHVLARRGRIHGAWRRERAGLHRGHDLRLQDRRRADRRREKVDGREGLFPCRSAHRRRRAQRDRLGVSRSQLRRQGPDRPSVVHRVRPLPHRLRGHVAPSHHQHGRRNPSFRGDRRAMHWL